MATDIASNIAIDSVDPRNLDLSQRVTAKAQNESGTDALFSGELEAFYTAVDDDWTGNWASLDSDIGLGQQYASNYGEVPVGLTTGSDTRLTTSATYDQQLVDRIVDGVSARLAAINLHGTTLNVLKDNTIKPPVIAEPDHNSDDSDCSWSLRDNYDSFYLAIGRELNDLQDTNGGSQVYISEPLNKRKRKFVHTLAHLRRLNHVTVKSKGDRVMLITYASIVDIESPRQRCWHRHPSQLDFRAKSVSLMFPSDMSEQQVDSLLEKVWIGTSVKWMKHSAPADSQKRTIVLGDVSEALSNYNAVRRQIASDVEFSSVNVVLGTWATRRDYPSFLKENFGQLQMEGEIHVRYCIIMTWREGKVIVYHFYAYWKHERRGIRRSRSSTRSNRSRGSLRGRRQTVMPENDGYASAGSGTSSKRSLSVYRADLLSSEDPTVNWHSININNDLPRHQQYLPLTEDAARQTRSPMERQVSLFDTLNSNGETTQVQSVPQQSGGLKDASDPPFVESDPKRRKRFPKGEYVCQEPGCDKVFEYVGDRTKHERIHAPTSEYPHACTWCPKRFINLKDAERHSKVHLRNKSWWPNILS